MAKKQILQQAGDGTAIPAGMAWSVFANKVSLSKLNTGTGAWELCTGNFGTPPAGTYLLINETTSSGSTGAIGFGGVINSSNASVIPVILQANATASGTTIQGIGCNVIYWQTDGTKTLYAWVLSAGSVMTVNVTATIIRIA
jgi:hypothetical protein